MTRTSGKHAADAGARIRIRPYLVFAVLLWTVTAGGALWWAVRIEKENALDLAETQARVLCDRYQLFMKPAYMSNGIHEMERRENGCWGRVASLNPVNKVNAPDSWETKSLHAFEAGVRERGAIEPLNGRPHFRYMVPLRAQEGCLACHGTQGYSKGDLMGGISVSVPLEPYPSAYRAHTRAIALRLGALWVLGLLGIGIGGKNLYKRTAEIERSQTALRESEGRFREMAEAMGEVFWISTPDVSRMLYLSPAFNRIWGRPRQSVFENPLAWVEAIHPEDRGTVLAALERHAQGEYDMEYRVVRPDGAIRWIHDRGYPVRDEAGRVVRMAGIAEDITDRKNAAAAALRSEQRYRTLFDSSRDAIMTTEPPSWRFTSGNPACVAMFGVKDEDEFTSYGPWELSPEHQPDGRPSGEKAKEMIETAMREGVHFFEWTHKRIGGEEFPATVLVTRVEIGGNAFLQSTVRDISRQRQLELELNQAQKLEAVGRLAAGIAHEINTPAQYVGDNIEFLQTAYASLVELIKAFPAVVEAGREGPIPPQLLSQVQGLIANANLDYLAEQVPRAIEQSLEGVGRISTIVQAMKEFSHPGSTAKSHADLNQCIRSTVMVSRNEWKYVADLEMHLEDTLPNVLCVAGEINQVILIMIVNAAHAIADVVVGTEQKGKIEIRTRQDGNWAVIEVADTGSGISEEIRERVFDPFFTTKEVGRGTGQGLAIARNVIVDKHGGTISVESEIGKGTVFTIRLPIDS